MMREALREAARAGLKRAAEEAAAHLVYAAQEALRARLAPVSIEELRERLDRVEAQLADALEREERAARKRGKKRGRKL